MPNWVFDGYVVRGLLGKGAMGVVYAVEDARSGERFALKALHKSEAELELVLKREFRSLANLQHTNLVTFHELFSGGGSATYFTMELVDGVHLDTATAKHLHVVPQEPRLIKSQTQLLHLLAQLVDGVDYLHQHHVLHRDIKPSNVLVDNQERLVLLDFGLSVSLRRAAEGVTGVDGTLPYVAPELFCWKAPSTASDWYAVGVVLYQVLTGELPFEPGHAHALAKQRGQFRPVNERNPAVPQALAQLVQALLNPDPQKRPDASSIRAMLPSALAPSRPSSMPPRSQEREVFVGRDDELLELRLAYEATLQRAPRIVLVSGNSGEGKTTLVEHFLSEPCFEQALVLRGRCHPSEFMTYKALDAVVDAMSDHLVKLGADAYPLLSEHYSALTRLFPVLARLQNEDWDDSPASGTDLQIRRAASAGLRAVLDRLSERQPIVVWIDDLQWGGEDSATLLLDLFRPPRDSRILFVLSFRDHDRRTCACLQALDRALGSAEFGGSYVCELGLPPLSAPLAKTLVEGVLRRTTELDSSAINECARQLYEEAGGNAFILRELAQHVVVSQSQASPSTRLSLEEVLDERVSRLPNQARELLEFVAAAGRPLSRSLLLEATVHKERVSTLLTMLVKGTLLRVNTAGTEPDYLVYHDRIREWAVRRLAGARWRAVHSRLGEALLSLPAPDPEQVAEHLVHAGEPERAAPFAYRAAQQAEATLAFERARQLYRLSLTLNYKGVPRADLHLRLGEACSNAGRGRLAAEAFLDALAAYPQTPESLRQRNALRVRASEAYLHAGHHEEGRRILAELLGEVGVTIPDSPAQAFRKALVRRVWMYLKGRRYRIRAPEDLDPVVLERCDRLWAGATGLVMVHHTIADAITVELTEEALRSGERSRISRALAFGATTESLIGGMFAKRSHATLSEAESLLPQARDNYDFAWLKLCAAPVAWFQFSWSKCVENGDTGLQIFRSLSRGTQWEQATIQAFRLSALYFLGSLQQVRAEVPLLIRDALERGDEFALYQVGNGHHLAAWLAADEPEQVIAWGNRAMLFWSSQQYSGAHYRDTISGVQALLYMGNAQGAVTRIESEWEAIEQSQLLLGSFIGSDFRFLRARAQLALLKETTDVRERSKLIQRVRSIRRQMRGGDRYTLLTRLLIDAALDVVSGRLTSALGALQTAEVHYLELQMKSHALACRLLRGSLGQDESLRSQAATGLQVLGVVRPEKFARLLLGQYQPAQPQSPLALNAV